MTPDGSNELVDPPTISLAVEPRVDETEPHPVRPNGNSSTGFRIEVFDSLTAVETVWRRATAVTANYVFQSYDWLLVWYETAGVWEGIRPVLVHVTDSGGRTLSLLPLGIQTSRGCRTLVFLGGRTSDYNAPMIDPAFAKSCTAEDFAALWQAILKRIPSVDLVWFKRMPNRIEGSANPMITLHQSKHLDNAHAASPLPATFAAFTGARKKKVFADTARQRRRVAAIGTVSFEIPEQPREILATVDLMLEQKRRRAHESGSELLGKLYEAFYRRISVSDLGASQPHVCRLRVGDDVVATHVGAVHGTRFYWLMPGYEAGEWARYSVGRLLQEEAVRWCIERRIETFDMTVGDEDYKRFWADTKLDLYTCRYALSAVGAIILALLRAREWARLNPFLRGLVVPLRRRLSPSRREISASGGT